jgi:hypothetical protein
MRRVILDL